MNTTPRMQYVPRNSTGVYLITCCGNGRVYVGSSAKCFRHRWGTHKNSAIKGKHVNRVFQRNWDKYGAESFSFEVIELCSREDCVKREQRWIDHHDAANPNKGMNLAPKAGSCIGVKRTPEMCAAHSARMMVTLREQDFRDAAAVRTRIQFSTPEARAAQSARIKLTHGTPEFRAAASDRAKKRFSTPAARAAMSERAKLVHGTQAAREANSARAKLQFSTPEARAAASARIRITHGTPAARAAMSERAKSWMSRESPEKKAARYAKVAATFAQKKAARVLAGA